MPLVTGLIAEAALFMLRLKPTLGFVLHLPAGIGVQHLGTSAVEAITNSIHQNDGQI